MTRHASGGAPRVSTPVRLEQPRSLTQGDQGNHFPAGCNHRLAGRRQGRTGGDQIVEQDQATSLTGAGRPSGKGRGHILLPRASFHGVARLLSSGSWSGQNVGQNRDVSFAGSQHGELATLVESALTATADVQGNRNQGDLPIVATGSHQQRHQQGSQRSAEATKTTVFPGSHHANQLGVSHDRCPQLEISDRTGSGWPAPPRLAIAAKVSRIPPPKTRGSAGRDDGRRCRADGAPANHTVLGTKQFEQAV